MILTTGNKSEYATGYATLYGDMCGGYAPIKDVENKGLRSSNGGIEQCHAALWGLSAINSYPDYHAASVSRLRPDPEDTDSLPPYDILDAILIALTEEMADIDTITGTWV